MKQSSIISHHYFVPFAIQIMLAYEWLSSSLGKISKREFIASINSSIGRFENGNPHQWYIHSMLGFAKNHPFEFGMLVQWGELCVGIGLVTSILIHAMSKSSLQKRIAQWIAITALAGGVFMNINFYFAAGWTSPSTQGLNVLMFWIQIILISFWVSKVDPKNE